MLPFRIVVAANFAMAGAIAILAGAVFVPGIPKVGSASVVIDLPAPAVVEVAPRPKMRAVLFVSGSEKLAELFLGMGYGLESVRAGADTVPRVFLTSMPGDLDDIAAVERRKKLFLESMLPLVLRANEAILRDRRRLVAVSEATDRGDAPAASDAAWLSRLAARYGTGPLDLDGLMRRVDVVPPSLALAQAAIESGWGTSRFAREGRAIFGQRVYGITDGIKPEARAEGEDFLIARFDGLDRGVASYIHNLNTHWAYKQLRLRRAELRLLGLRLDGALLATSLTAYSERGEDYVRDLRAIIRANDLRPLDRARLNTKDAMEVVAAGT